MTEDRVLRFDAEARVVEGEPHGPFLYVDTDIRESRLPVDNDVDVLIDSAHMERVDFSNIRFLHFQARQSTFVDCDFSGISSRTGGTLGHFPGSRYIGCHFDGADLRRIGPGQARFERCAFTDVRIRDWTADDASFVDCVFSGRIEQSMFYGRRTLKYPDESTLPPPNDFIGNDFSGADLVDVSFRAGLDLRKQQLPRGGNYLLLDGWQERVARARHSIGTWEPASIRASALRVLDIYWNEDSDQESMLLRRDDLGKGTPAIVLERVFAELERPLSEPRGARDGHGQRRPESSNFD